MVQHSPLVNCKNCSSYVKEAFTFHMEPEHRNEIWSPRTVPRLSFPNLNCLITLGGAILGNKSNDSLQILEVKENVLTWKELEKRPSTECQRICSMVATQFGICVTGGALGNETLKRCQLYDPKTGRWKNMQEMINRRARHASVVHNGNVYVMGGEDDPVPLKSVEMYSHVKEKWIQLADMPIQLQHLLAVTHGQFIYVFSGHLNTKTKAQTKVWAYSTLWGRWEEKKDMPKAVKGPAVAVLNDTAFVVGGTPNSCLSYDMTLDTWTILTPPALMHGYPAAAMWQGKVLLSGGFDGTEHTSVIEAYDPATDCWSFWDLNLKEPLGAHHLLYINDFGNI